MGRCLRKECKLRFGAKAHDVAGEVGRAEVYPIGCVRDLVDTSVGRQGLIPLTEVPCGDGIEGYLVGIGFVDSSERAGAFGIPRRHPGIGR